MIPVDQKIEVKGSFGGDTFAMGIQAENLKHIMRVTTDLYSDNELAFIREYSTNADDSHRMAGTDRPIEIFLPTPLRQTFEVQDYGLGLSIDEIVNVYGSYGASLKRDNNDVNGCLGLGSKSALTYASMFTVRAVKNGVQADVAIRRDDENGGSIEVIDTRATDAPNGVRVIIPTNVRSDFDDKVNHFFSFWPTGSVLINGKPNTNIADRTDRDSFWIDSKTLIVSTKHYNAHNDYIVMGNVAYPAKFNRDQYWYDSYAIVYFADMGEVEFVPSREALNITPRVKGVLDRVGDATKRDKIRGHWQDKPKADIFDAADHFFDASKYLSHVAIKYNDEVVENHYDLRHRRFSHDRSYGGRRKNYTKTTQGLRLTERNDYVFIVGNGSAPMSDANRDRMSKHMGDDYEKTVVLLDNSSQIPAVFGNCPVYQWDDIKAIKIASGPRSSSSPRKAVPEYDWYSKTKTDYSKLPSGTYYIAYTQDEAYSHRQFLKDGEYIVYVSGGRVNKFKRLYQHKSISALRDREIAKLPTITPEEVDVLSESSMTLGFLVENIDKLLDPMLVLMGKHAKRKDDILNIYRQYRTLGVTPMGGGTHGYVTENYPLMQRYQPEHSIIYMNAIYQENQK